MSATERHEECSKHSPSTRYPHSARLFAVPESAERHFGSLRSILPLLIGRALRHRFEFWVVLCGPGLGLDDPCGSLLTQDILWFCDLSASSQPGFSDTTCLQGFYHPPSPRILPSHCMLLDSPGLSELPLFLERYCIIQISGNTWNWHSFQILQLMPVHISQLDLKRGVF